MKNDAYQKSYIYRSPDKDFISSSIQANAERILIIYGDAGSGKTFLAEQVINPFSGRAHILRNKFSSDLSMCLFLEKLILDLVHESDISLSLDTITLKRRLTYFFDINESEVDILISLIEKNSSSYNLGVLYSLFQKLLNNTKGKKIIFLDDAHWISDQINDFFSNISISKDITFVLTSRTKLKISHSNVLHHQTLPLTDFDIKNIIIQTHPLLSKRKNIISLVVEKSKGNIFFLNILLDFIEKNNFENNTLLENFIQSASVSANFLYGTSRISKIQRTILELLSLEFPLDKKTLTNILDKKSLNTDINYLIKSGLIIEHQSGLSLPHDIFGDQLRHAMPADDKANYHLMIAKSFLQSNRNRISILEKVSFHYFESKNWILAYKYMLLVANFYMKQHRPNEAINAIKKAEHSCKALGLLTDKRHLNLSIQACKARFLLGVSDSVSPDIKILEHAYKRKNVSKKNVNEIINLLSLYYWNNGQLEDGYTLLKDFESTGVADDKNMPLFKFRQIGILSDMGEFCLSNSLAIEYVEKNLIQGIHDILGIPYSIRSAILSIISRNFAYLNDSAQSENYRIAALNAHPDDNSSTNIFSLCFLADANIAINNLDLAKELTVTAISKAKKYNLTALNSFLFSLLGYLEVLEGKNSSLSKIEMAIKSAENENRLGRLPRYYLFLIKAKKEIDPKTPLRRLSQKALKMARRNKEQWVASAIQETFS